MGFPVLRWLSRWEGLKQSGIQHWAALQAPAISPTEERPVSSGGQTMAGLSPAPVHSKANKAASSHSSFLDSGALSDYIKKRDRLCISWLP